jgi:hypothetical protein
MMKLEKFFLQLGAVDMPVIPTTWKTEWLEQPEQNS